MQSRMFRHAYFVCSYDKKDVKYCNRHVDFEIILADMQFFSIYNMHFNYSFYMHTIFKAVLKFYF